MLSPRVRVRPRLNGTRHRSGEDYAALAVLHEHLHVRWVGKSYNLTVARVRVDGENLGATLIVMGAAWPWLRHQLKRD
jgi:endonuclease YncB( thermonuclease family)